MKRVRVSILLAVILVVSAIPSANAVVAPGSKCSKAGLKQTFNGKVYTCVKFGKKFVWDKGFIVFPKPKITVVSSTDNFTWNIQVLNYSKIKLDRNLIFSYIFSINNGMWVEGFKSSTDSGSISIEKEFSMIEFRVRLKRDFSILQESDSVVRIFSKQVIPIKPPTPTPQPSSLKEPRFIDEDLDAINSIIYINWNGKDSSFGNYSDSDLRQINIWIKGGDFGEEFTKYVRSFQKSEKIEINVSQRVTYCVKLQAESLLGILSDFSDSYCLTVLKQPTAPGAPE
jgi:hypothetical protein